MKTPWRCQVEQTPHREVYNGGGVVFKGSLYNQGVTRKVSVRFFSKSNPGNFDSTIFPEKSVGLT